MRLCGIFSTTIGREAELGLDEEIGEAEGPMMEEEMGGGERIRDFDPEKITRGG